MRTNTAPTPLSPPLTLSLQREEKGRSPAPTLQRELRGLRQLRSLAVDVPLTAPTDTKRGGLWEAWIRREAGLITYKKNRRALNSALKMCKLVLSGLADNSSLRQLLSVKDITLEMAEVVRVAVEIEATRARGVRLEGKQELVGDEDVMAELVIEGEEEGYCAISIATIQAALNVVCSITAAPGGSAGFDGAASGGVRTREEIAALAQDKHEKALTSNVVSAGEIGVTYDMIGGLDEVKELLRESITYPLKFPQFYSEGIAKEAVKGVLLFGPPGTGKTMLAKAVATEGQATFLSIDASSVENKWLGESEKNAKAVFTLARRLAPCVIFMDEVDSLLSSRESSDDSAHGTLTSVKTTMMMEWDGLSSGGGRVVVIGSTNRPFDLDEAVLRRFPRRILVDLPDLNTRQEILEVTLAQNRVAKEVNFTKVRKKGGDVDCYLCVWRGSPLFRSRTRWTATQAATSRRSVGRPSSRSATAWRAGSTRERTWATSRDSGCEKSPRATWRGPSGNSRSPSTTRAESSSRRTRGTTTTEKSSERREQRGAP